MQRMKVDEKACASGAVITIDENACASGPSTDPSSLSSTGRGGPRRLIWEGPLLADEDIGPVVGPENFAVAWPIKTVLSIYKHPRIDGFGMIDNGNPGILKIALTIVPRGSVRIIIIRRPEDITLLIRVKLPVKTATESILGRDQPDDTVSRREQQLIVAWHSLFKVDRKGHVCSWIICRFVSFVRLRPLTPVSCRMPRAASLDPTH